jgi:hypothetical protein
VRSMSAGLETQWMVSKLERAGGHHVRRAFGSLPRTQAADPTNEIRHRAVGRRELRIRVRPQRCQPAALDRDANVSSTESESP